jgi:predicted nuclease of predicted toxin-antitoxin system
LLDENFPAPAIRRILEAGIDVLSIADSHPGVSDTRVLSIAVAEQRWLVTFDLDFGTLLFAQRLPPPPAVLLIRVSHYLPDEPAQWVLEWIKSKPAPTDMFTVFDGESFRFRPLRVTS